MRGLENQSVCRLAGHRRAVTLVELLIVAMLLAILAAIVVPTAHDGVTLQIEEVTSRVLSDLAYAQSQAIVRRAPQCVVFDVTQGYYYLAPLDMVVTPMTDPITRKPYRVLFQKAQDIVSLRTQPCLESYTDVDLADVSFDGSTVLTFGALGEPLASPAVALLEGKIEIAVGDRRKVIVVDPVSGKASVQDAG